jgi:hypothetical protein
MIRFNDSQATAAAAATRNSARRCTCVALSGNEERVLRELREALVENLSAVERTTMRRSAKWGPEREEAHGRMKAHEQQERERKRKPAQYRTQRERAEEEKTDLQRRVVVNGLLRVVVEAAGGRVGVREPAQRQSRSERSESHSVALSRWSSWRVIGAQFRCIVVRHLWCSQQSAQIVLTRRKRAPRGTAGWRSGSSGTFACNEPEAQPMPRNC